MTQIVAANREYNRALALNASLPQAWLNIAALHQQYGQVRESIPSYLVRLLLCNRVVLLDTVCKRATHGSTASQWHCALSLRKSSSCRSRGRACVSWR